MYAPFSISRLQQLLTLLTACLSVLILPASLTGASVAIPRINAELHPGLVELQWVVNAYNLTFAAFMLISGSLADILGRKRVFIFGATLFALCSLASALANNVLLLDVSRGLSGIGAAAMMTAGSALLAQAYTGEQLAKAFAVFGSAAGAGLAIGPSLSGFLVGLAGWRSVFGLHLAVSIVILLLTVGISAGQETSGTSRIDWAGAGAFTPALFSFVLAIMQGPQLGWTSPLVMIAGAVCVVFGVLFILVERKSSHPMFDFTLLRNPRFFTLCLIPVTLAFSFVALLVYLPIYFTAAYGFNSGVVGWIMVVMTVPVVLVPLVAGQLLGRGATARWLLAISMLLVGVGAGALLVIDPKTSVVSIAPGLLLIGAGMGLSAGILDGAAVGSVSPERAGTAAGMFNTSRLAGETIGVAVIGTLLVRLVQNELRGSAALQGRSANQAANQVLGGNIAELAEGDNVLTAALSQAFTSALHIVLGGMLVIAIITAAIVLILMREDSRFGDQNTNGDDVAYV